MARFADHTVLQFLDALGGPAPTPGGGTASAVAGAMGVSLLMMVAGMTKTRGNTDAERTALAGARTALAALRDRLVTLADTDTEAYNQVTAAYRLPKATDEEKGVRREAIQRAMQAATEAPLDTLRTAVEAMDHAKAVARCGNPSAASDVKVALELLEAAAAGAAANVEINLSALTDEGYRKKAASDMLELANRLKEASADSRAVSTPDQSE